MNKSTINPMAQNTFVVVLQLSDRLPAQLLDTLTSKGFSSSVVREFQEAVSLLSAKRASILLADFGNNERRGYNSVKKLIELQELHTHPLILIGKDADEYEAPLNESFILATTLNAPVRTKELSDSLAYTLRAFENLLLNEKAAEKAVPPPSAPPPEQPLEVETVPPPHQLYLDFDSMAEMFFERSSAAELQSKDLGGAAYVRAIREAAFGDGSHLPFDSKVNTSISELCATLGTWERAHLHRVAFLCKQFGDALQFTPETQELTQSAAFLFALSISQHGRKYLRKEYPQGKSMSFRKDLCSRVKDSAMKVAVELDRADLANFIALLAKLVGREATAGDSEHEIAASTIMGADIVDRACWASGFFNPRGAYHLLRRVKNGEIQELHPLVMCCVVKVLSEATHLCRFKFLMLRGGIGTAAPVPADEERLRWDETKVTLEALAPGMKITRPLHTYDGREILQRDLTLDQDLIMRLWQLALVRPLQQGDIVVRKRRNPVR